MAPPFTGCSRLLRPRTEDVRRGGSSFGEFRGEKTTLPERSRSNHAQVLINDYGARLPRSLRLHLHYLERKGVRSLGEDDLPGNSGYARLADGGRQGNRLLECHRGDGGEEVKVLRVVQFIAQLPVGRLPAAIVAIISLVFLAGGCTSHRHVLRAFQNGKELGRWTVNTDPISGNEALMGDDRRLVVIPADGVFTGSLWYRS